MASHKKEYEMQFKLAASLGSSYSATFNKAQAQLAALQKEIGSLSKIQSDVAAYQKQQQSIESTGNKLTVLRQQYDNIQKEIKETAGFSASLENKLLSRQQQIDKTSASLGQQTEKLNQLAAALKEAGVDTSKLEGESAKLNAQIQDLKTRQDQAADGAQDFGSTSIRTFAAIQQAIAAAGIAVALKQIADYYAECVEASMEFEEAMTGVAKTTELSDAEFASMSSEMQELSTLIPITTTELAAIAETAGQLGIMKSSLLGFTEIMAMLGTATNMTAEEAATMLAQFASITGMNPAYYSNLGSTIVALGNSFATTEKNISDMSQSIAAAGAIAGMSEAEIAGIAAAVTSLGITAQNGGTQMTKLISDINTAVSSGENLDDWAMVAGMTAESFAEVWGTNAANALDMFVRGLNSAYESGQDVYGVLSDLGISETRMVTMITSLAQSGTRLTETLQTANSAWSENTALAAEAEKRYATTQSQLMMMQNAYNNLKIAIGDNFTPALRTLYATATDVLNSLTDFVEEYPALIKTIGIFTGVMGSAVMGLSAFAAMVKVVIPMTKLFIATLAAVPGANVILGVAAAVAAVTSGIVALVSAANEGVPKLKELTEAAREMEGIMQEATSAYDDTISSTLAAASVADAYISKLEALEASGELTTEEAKEYHDTLAMLCQVVPELANQIDLTTDTINVDTAALRANTEAWKENAMRQGYQEQWDAMYSSYSDVVTEAAKNSLGLAIVQSQLDVAQKKEADTLARMNELYREATEQVEENYQKYGLLGNATDLLTQEYYDLQYSLYDTSDAIRVAEKSIKTYQGAIEDDGLAVAEAEEQLRLFEEAFMHLSVAMEFGSDVSAEMVSEIFAMKSTINNTTTEIDRLTDSYNQAYEAALVSISGQYDLWDEAADVALISAASINSALEDQISYWQDYNADIASLTERSADIEGLSEVIASFADGSEESVNAIAGMAEASGDELKAMVANWRLLQDEQKITSGSLADLVEEYSKQITEWSATLAEEIDAMDLSAEAAESARSTIQEFIDTANEMLPQVQAAYASIGQAMGYALSPDNSIRRRHQNVSGFAGGTQSAPPGLAIVGERGPELVYFEGGEQVMTAAETEAMLFAARAYSPQLISYLSTAGSSTALSAESGIAAISSNANEVFAPVANVTINLSGDGRIDVENMLNEYGEEIKERIIDTMENYWTDKNRRAYA